MHIYCYGCRARLDVVKNGAWIKLGPRQWHACDVLECPECHMRVVSGISIAYLFEPTGPKMEAEWIIKADACVGESGQ